MDKPSQKISPEQVKDHPILQRVLRRLEEQMANREETTAHTVHNSHYSSLTKEDGGAPASGAGISPPLPG